METIFWLSLVGIAYPYIGYPALLWLLCRLTKRRPLEGPAAEHDRLPSVTLIVSAYNEEQVIGEKIKNALSLDYPRDLLEIVVVSDGSSDRTADIAAGFAASGVVLRHYEGRIGKTACLNRAIPSARGEVIVFSDANSTYETGALKALVGPLRDATVGFVTGWTRYDSKERSVATESLGLYSRLELWTKELESALGSCVGADGAIFAVRKALCRPLRDFDINDFVIPLGVNEQGYRGVLQRDARCYEKDAGGAKAEFHRQVRITNRTIRAIVNHAALLNVFRFGFFSIELLSHKLCRYLVPIFMATLLASSLALAASGWIFATVLAGQLIFYGGAGVSGVMQRAGFTFPRAEAARTFIVVNVAIALAWIKYLQGETYITWSPTKR